MAKEFIVILILTAIVTVCAFLLYYFYSR